MSRSPYVYSRLIAIMIAAVGMTTTVAHADSPPTPPQLLDASPPSKNILSLPDGSLEILYLQRGKQCVSIRSTDGGETWSQPHAEFPFTKSGAGIPVTLVDRDGELHAILTVRRGDGRKPTVDYFIDIWHCRTSKKRTEWSEPQRIFAGYVGSLNGITQLPSGRIVLPHQYWVPGRKSTPPTGSHIVTTTYTDDGGKTWTQSPAELTAPCEANYIGSNYGACEPCMLPLKDGRAWMLMRSQTGYMYQSFSPDGADWTPAVASPFIASNSPASLLRLTDGRIVVFWNNCENPSRVDGAPIYTSRDALHVAISEDEGQTWQGFREVVRDPLRNESPPKQGDRGTAYPYSAETPEGDIILATGQGGGRISLMRIDPDWITATTAADDFSDGLNGWCTFKPFGPAARYWRDRTTGPVLIEHPSQSGKQVLQVRRPDEKPADEAVWNVPAGRTGRLKLRLKQQPGFQGGRIVLADRFIPPGDPVTDKLAAFVMPLSAEGEITDHDWHAIELSWNLDQRVCRVKIDGTSTTELPLVNSQSGAVSYLRLASTADEIDEAGFLVESVRADVTAP
ncbi:BNR/Asp-box repeat protein [Symmachiella dynata]|uniref:sialidase family protein n=1 Tax=Symmachiella dynata TaxID=2527995 RepID=UPI0011880094|nr:sialidase family protein [Symmachiella dynata]QDT47380.1 BNR/Asp-box repeat protein [Symmachiella dynata]